MNAPTVTVTAYVPVNLNEEHEKNLQTIESIKRSVSQDYDNINHPVGIYEQLTGNP